MYVLKPKNLSRNVSRSGLDTASNENLARYKKGRDDYKSKSDALTAKIDKRTATADRLTYLAETEQYDLRSTGRIPARIVDGCLESSGKTLTYFKATNRIRVNGNDEITHQSKSAGCPQSPAASR